jgi:hypothetical protein
VTRRDIGDLADSLGVRVLQVPGNVIGRSGRCGGYRSGPDRSPALKAFLSGEQFYRRGRWDSALVYYDQAIAQDTTFAIAYRRMDLALSWNPANSAAYRPGEEYRRRAVTLNRGLSPKGPVC